MDVLGLRRYAPGQLREGGVRTAFRAQGMSRIASPPGMYARTMSARVKPAAPLTFERVCTEDTRLEFAHIASIVFSLPFGTSKRIYGATGLWDSPSYGWVGYFKGKAVAIVTVVIASDAIGVTLSEHFQSIRGRGFGETLLRHAIDDARQRQASNARCCNRHSRESIFICDWDTESVTNFSHLCAGRLRLFLTICHTRRIMPFWLACLTALVVCSLVQPIPQRLPVRSRRGNMRSNGDWCTPAPRV